MSFLRVSDSESMPIKLIVYLIILITILLFVFIFLNIRHVEKTIDYIGTKAGLAQENIEQLQREKLQGIYLLGLVAIILVGLAISLMITYHRYLAGTSQLKNLERRQDSILAALVRGVIIVDGGGRLVTLNQSAKNMLGNPGVTAESRAAELLPSRKGISDFFIQMTREGPEPVDVELLTRDENGSDRFIKMSGTRIYDHQNRSIGGVIFLQDITEVKKFKARTRINEHLMAIGRIAEGVSHEIRKPLNALNIHVQLLKEHLENGQSFPNEKTFRYVQIIKNEINHLNRTLTDFNEYTLPAFTSESSVDIHELLEDLNIFYQPEAEASGISLTCDLNARDHRVRGNQDKLRDVFTNLLANAIESIDKGGDVSVETETEENHQFMAIMFRDTGYGIPLEDLGKIFNLYYTTKKGGNGIGLTMASRIVHQHGGTIDAVSWLGEGSLFTVRLPIEKGPGS